MVGGGEGAFIGPVHRMAAELDGAIELVCGVFSSDPARSLSSGQDIYGLDAARCYPDLQTMLTAEKSLPEHQRMEFVSIVTPNHLHVSTALAVVQAGFCVVCDKPLSHELQAALDLERALRSSDLLFALTHNYTGYPMIREARQLIASGTLGRLRRIDCEYLQGWLSTAAENTANPQARWRTDPARAGAAGCFGDIGSHCQNLIEYVSGQRIHSVCADLTAFVAQRQLDDDGNVLLRFDDGARGVISASQIAVGEENALTLRVYGEKGGLSWSQQEPNSLQLRWPDRPLEVRRAGGAGISAEAASAGRLPAGHVEGYLEAFANLYRSFAAAMRRRRQGNRVNTAEIDWPDITAGVRGMRFITAVVASSQAGGTWCEM